MKGDFHMKGKKLLSLKLTIFIMILMELYLHVEVLLIWNVYIILPIQII